MCQVKNKNKKLYQNSLKYMHIMGLWDNKTSSYVNWDLVEWCIGKTETSCVFVCSGVGKMCISMCIKWKMCFKKIGLIWLTLYLLLLNSYLSLSSHPWSEQRAHSAPRMRRTSNGCCELSVIKGVLILYFGTIEKEIHSRRMKKKKFKTH